jgi:DNA-binding transcriptional MocR family regulator
VIERAGAWLVEDDGHAALLEGAPAPISAHIPERSYYVSSMSKPVSPGLRTAYVVAPTARDAERLARSLNALGQFPAPIVVEITTEWITEGHTTSAVSAMRQSAAERWDIARAVLPQLRAGAAFTNHFGWLPLPTGWHAESFAERARAHGVRVSPSSAFAVAARFAKPGLRVCLGAAPTLQQLSQSLEVLSDVLREDPLLSRPIY